MKSLWMRFVLFLIVGVAPFSSALAGLSFYGGLHGGPLNRYTAPSPEEPIKGGLVGLNYGYQVGMNFEKGPLWTGAMYRGSYIFAEDYVSQTTPRAVLRYANPSVVLPLMYRIAKGQSAFGIGAFYAHPLTDEAHRDSGFTLAANVGFKGSFYGGVNVFGGLRDYPHGGSSIQTCISLGYRLK